MQPPFDLTNGVLNTQVGYSGGDYKNPTYQLVCSGETDHIEVLQVEFDPEIISYEELLKVFWQNINPIQINGQFFDQGFQYQTAILYVNEKQKEIAQQSKKELDESEKFNEPIATVIIPATTFYPAEDYHQKYYMKNTEHYNQYKVGSGRQKFIEDNWK